MNIFRQGLPWLLAVVLGAAQAAQGFAQGTRQWTVDRYDQFERGSIDGVAIRSDGRLGGGLRSTPIYQASGSYVWTLAPGSAGEVYAGLGGSSAGSAAVVRIGAKGGAENIFTGKELGVQAIRVGKDGSVYAATSPDGKVYRIEGKGGPEQVLFDAAKTAERPKYIWDLALAADGSLYVATGAPAALYRIAPSVSTTPRLLFRTADLHLRTLLFGRGDDLWIGSDGAGIVYRFNPRKPDSQPFAAYVAGRREITALTMVQLETFTWPLWARREQDRCLLSL